MLDIAVGIVILLFIALGLREGIIKSLGSVAVVFVALFVATGAINLLSQSNPQFSDPNYLGATIAFLVVWGLSYLGLDLLLTLLLKKVITVIVLGPVDKIGGLLIGGFKGVLICGIVLQLSLYLPFSEESKKQITEAPLSRFTIAAYQWAYPYAKRIAPRVNEFMKKNLIEKISERENLEEKTEDMKKISPEQFMENASEYKKTEKEQEKKIKQLIKEQKLLPTVPQGK
jgi:uncharacterized membrane protein required for colicin V production